MIQIVAIFLALGYECLNRDENESSCAKTWKKDTIYLPSAEASIWIPRHERWLEYLKRPLFARSHLIASCMSLSHRNIMSSLRPSTLTSFLSLYVSLTQPSHPSFDKLCSILFIFTFSVGFSNRKPFHLLVKFVPPGGE